MAVVVVEEAGDMLNEAGEGVRLEGELFLDDGDDLVLLLLLLFILLFGEEVEGADEAEGEEDGSVRLAEDGIVGECDENVEVGWMAGSVELNASTMGSDGVPGILPDHWVGEAIPWHKARAA